MSKKDKQIIMQVVIVFMLGASVGVFITSFTSVLIAVNQEIKWQSEAIEKDYAEHVIVDKITGGTEWRWIEPKSKAIPNVEYVDSYTAEPVEREVGIHLGDSYAASTTSTEGRIATDDSITTISTCELKLKDGDVCGDFITLMEMTPTYDIRFMDQDGISLELKADGRILYKGKEIEKDKELVDAMRDLIQGNNQRHNDELQKLRDENERLKQEIGNELEWGDMEEKKKCTHDDKAYSMIVLASYPSQHAWICRTCGFEGVDIGATFENDYEAIIEKFKEIGK